MNAEKDELLNYSSAAVLLKMPIGSLYGMVSKRQIPHIRLCKRVVRFSKAELMEWISKHRVEEKS